jgi:hypothetical protein
MDEYARLQLCLMYDLQYESLSAIMSILVSVSCVSVVLGLGH